MPRCVTIKRKHRKICTGDLDSRVTVQVRSLTPSNTGVDALESFVDTIDEWALVTTVSGEAFFDDVDQSTDVTHHVYINYRPDVSAETWLETESSERLDILNVENLDERSEYLLLRCTNRGSTGKDASGA